MSGLQQCGVSSIPLDTQELIEMYYDAYNPDTATRQPLRNFEAMNAPIIEKRVLASFAPTTGKGAPSMSLNRVEG